MNGKSPPCKSDRLPLTLYKQLNTGLNFDAAAQTAVFDDIDSAIHFRRRFPWWEVRCLITLPRHNSAAGESSKNGQKPTTAAAHHPPTPPTISCGIINLLHPLLTVPATAIILGLWRENGRAIGLEWNCAFQTAIIHISPFKKLRSCNHDEHRQLTRTKARCLD